MALNRRIHLYTVDTACFYTDKEKILGDKLSRSYVLRKKAKTKNQKTRINKFIKHYKTKLVEEFQQTRDNCEIRELREESVNEHKVVSIFESTLVRQLGVAPNEFTEDLMIVQVYFFQVAEDLIKNGFMYKNEKYVLFSASAGQIRTKKFVVIKESRLKEIEQSLMCGMCWDRINECGGINPNKYLAYYALNSSATDVWEDFDIDKAIVVNDFIMHIDSEVDYINDETYEITRRTMNVELPHMDGCGIKLNGKNHMVRLPWIKGLMGTFDFRTFVLEMREKYNNPNIGKIEDIWGKQYDVIEDNIEYIFTESQMKINKPYYQSWDEYKYNFKKYNCEACVCNIEETNIKDAKINYQMLQTLSDITKDEFAKIAKSTIKDIEEIGHDYRTTMRILGVHDGSANWMQKSLLLYPELMRDVYNKQLLRDLKKSLVKQAKAGRLNINGKYTFVMPDLYGFCEWLFLGIENPKGLLEQNEVICNLYTNNRKLCCLRSPHLYREWGLATNKINHETNKWFKGSNAIYVSTRSLLSKLLMFDSDGDILLVIDDKHLYKIAERNMQGIVPLYYDLRKAKKTELSKNSIYDGLSLAYTSANIGIISNNISKVWNTGDIQQEQIDVVKLLCMQNNEVIDYAKTLWKSTPPTDKEKLLKKYTSMKLPRFFKYAKNKNDAQIQDNLNGVINMLEEIIPTNKIKFDTRIKKPDYRILMSDKDFVFNSDSTTVVDAYDYWNRRLSLSGYWKKIDSDKYTIESDLFVHKYIRERMLELPFEKDFIVNSLVKFMYEMRKTSFKKLMWSIFGEEIYENIKNNTQNFENICPICGRRIPKINGCKARFNYCSNECYSIANRERAKYRKRRILGMEK